MKRYKYFRRTKDIVEHAKPLEPLIFPSFVLGHLTLVVGDSGTCKTTLIAGLANSVVKEEEFLDLTPLCPVKIAILDLESGDSLIKERYEEVLRMKPSDISPDIWTCNEAIAWKFAQDELMRLVREEGVNLIFIDHIFIAFPPEDMGSATEALKMMEEQRAFAQYFNVCIVSLLHPPIESRGGIRKGFGSIYKTNSIDVQINLTPDEVIKNQVWWEVVKDRCYNQLWHFTFRKSEGEFVKLEDKTQHAEGYQNKTEVCRSAICSLTQDKPQPTAYYLENLAGSFKENMIKVELSHLAKEGTILKIKHGMYKVAEEPVMLKTKQGQYEVGEAGNGDSKV